jgi:hypothetical protein
MRHFASVVFTLLLASTLPALARPTCDVSGADAAALASAYAAIDTECPCDSATGPSAYHHCARETVDTLVAAASLPATCRRDAQRYANDSTCGREGALVCCRADGNGRTRHRIVRDSLRCVDVAEYVACVSAWQSLVTGCDASGCVPMVYPVCGNSVTEAGEQCDPPSLTCDTACQLLPPFCGNLVVDDGEACEPPGVGSCSSVCQAATCSAAAAGETEITCVDGATRLSSAANATGYLVAWSGPFQRSDEVLAIRLDGDGGIADPALTVVSSELPDGNVSSYPSAASDGAGFYVVWSTYGEPPGYPGVFEQRIEGRRLGADSGADATDTLISHIPFGYCRSSLAGPTAASGAGASRFAATWQNVASCGGGVINRDPDAAFIDFAEVPTTTSASLGFPLPQALPAVMSSSAATVASLSGSSLWTWHAQGCDAEYSCVPFLAAAWSDGTATQGPFPLSSESQVLTDAPGMAAGATGFLVVWAQPNAEATATEVRGVRVTRADGLLDPDGGLLLATVANGVNGSPSVAFDGTRWLVAWTEAGALDDEVRAVAVNVDGSVVDSTPRLVADEVAPAPPSASSTGNGSVLVAFTRDEGAQTAIRATLVVP